MVPVAADQLELQANTAILAYRNIRGFIAEQLDAAASRASEETMNK